MALTRIAGWLRPGGKLYLRDVVLPQPGSDYAEVLDAVVNDNAQTMREQWVRHLRQEYSTVNWIMEGLLTRAGFRLERCEYLRGVFGVYLGVKGTGGSA